MNNKTAKEIRKIILKDDSAISRRNYRRFKKKYQELPAKYRADFLKEAKRQFS